MKYSAIIWDFDGTLFDTYPLMSRAMTDALAALGVEAAFSQVYRLFKQSKYHVAEYYARYGVEQDALFAQYQAASKRLQQEGLSMVKPYPHVLELVRCVARAGGSNYIFTHRGDSIWDFLRHFDLLDCFVDVVCQKDGFARKPSPQGNAYILKTHGVNPASAIAVGDRELDILAGKGAGMSACLFVEQGPTPPTAADAVIRDFSELYPILGLPQETVG